MKKVNAAEPDSPSRPPDGLEPPGSARAAELRPGG